MAMIFLLAFLQLQNWRGAHEAAILKQFTEFLSIPNVASDKGNLAKNAQWIVTQLKQRGVATRLLEDGDTPPVVFGEIATPGATRTIVYYAHYDGQPVEPAKWTGNDPFAPRLVQDSTGSARIYARSASDDKAAIVAMLNA